MKYITILLTAACMSLMTLPLTSCTNLTDWVQTDQGKAVMSAAEQAALQILINMFSGKSAVRGRNEGFLKQQAVVTLEARYPQLTGNQCKDIVERMTPIAKAKALHQ